MASWRTLRVAPALTGAKHSAMHHVKSLVFQPGVPELFLWLHRGRVLRSGNVGNAGAWVRFLNVLSNLIY